MIHKRSAALGAAAGSLLGITLLVTFACQKKADQKTAPRAEAKDAIASVDDVTITVGDVEDRINKQSPYVRARYTSLAQKRDLVDNLIRIEVLAAEAKRRGYDQDPEVVRTMKQVMIQKLINDEFTKSITPEDVTEQEMRKFYDEHQAEYHRPEEIRVAAIVIKDEKKAAEVAALARDEQHKDTKSFQDLVAQHSEDDASKQLRGDLKYFTRDSKELPAAVIEAAFLLRKGGEVAGPIKTDAGYYILKQTGLRNEFHKNFEEVRRQIQQRLFREKREQAMKDFVDGLRARAKISVNDDALAKIKIDTAAPGEPEPHELAPDQPSPALPGTEPPPM